MGASPGPDGPEKKFPVCMTVNYLWLVSGVDCPRFRKMATNGSAWGQVSNRKNGQIGSDGGLSPPKMGPKKNNWVPIPIIYHGVGS
jgi:hypothetical protein